MLPVFDIMYCLRESFGSGHHSCESPACISALVSFMLFCGCIGSCVLLCLWEVMYS